MNVAVIVHQLMVEDKDRTLGRTHRESGHWAYIVRASSARMPPTLGTTLLGMSACDRWENQVQWQVYRQENITMAKPKPSRHAPEEIDAYLEALVEDRRVALERLRGIIRETAPDCTERVSYGIPIFRLQKDLVGISAQENHCSLHSMSPTLMEAMAEVLAGFKVSGATIQFSTDKPLPRELVERIVHERIKEMDSV